MAQLLLVAQYVISFPIEISSQPFGGILRAAEVHLPQNLTADALDCNLPRGAMRAKSHLIHLKHREESSIVPVNDF